MSVNLFDTPPKRGFPQKQLMDALSQMCYRPIAFLTRDR